MDLGPTHVRSGGKLGQVKPDLDPTTILYMYIHHCGSTTIITDQKKNTRITDQNKTLFVKSHLYFDLNMLIYVLFKRNKWFRSMK